VVDAQNLAPVHVEDAQLIEGSGRRAEADVVLLERRPLGALLEEVQELLLARQVQQRRAGRRQLRRDEALHEARVAGRLPAHQFEIALPFARTNERDRDDEQHDRGDEDDESPPQHRRRVVLRREGKRERGSVGTSAADRRARERVACPRARSSTSRGARACVTRCEQLGRSKVEATLTAV